MDCSQADQFYDLNIEVAEKNARRQAEREEAREKGEEEERERVELTAEQIESIRNGGEVPVPSGKTAKLTVKQTSSNRRPKAGGGRSQSKTGSRSKPTSKSKPRGQSLGFKKPSSSKRGPKSFQATSQKSKFSFGQVSVTSKPVSSKRGPKSFKATTQKSKSSFGRLSVTSKPALKKSKFLSSGSKSSSRSKPTTTRRPKGVRKPNIFKTTSQPSRKSANSRKGKKSKSTRGNKSKNSKNPQSGSTKKTGNRFSLPKNQPLTFGRFGKGANKKRPQRQLNIEEPDFQQLQLDLSEPATTSETFIQQKIEEQEKSDDGELRLKQFEAQLQERIDLQDAEFAVPRLSDQIEKAEREERLEEEAILAEQRRLNEQRIAQQQLLEERRKEQLEKLNNQIQQRIENTLKRDLAEKLKQEDTDLISNSNQEEEDGRSNRSKEESNFLPGRVPKLMKRRKVRRRRPKPSETVELLEETSSGSPFTKFGNGQSRFGFGG